MIASETNQVKSKFFDNLSRLVYGLTPEDFFSIKTNKGKVKGTILDYLKVFDRQFMDPATKEIRNQDKILRKNFYSFDIELFYIAETNELKVLDFGKRTIKPPSLTKFKLTSAITDTKTLKDYLSIKEQEKRFIFIFDKIKNKAIKTLEFWVSIELEESKRFFAVLTNKLPIEFISDKELELINFVNNTIILNPDYKTVDLKKSSSFIRMEEIFEVETLLLKENIANINKILEV